MDVSSPVSLFQMKSTWPSLYLLSLSAQADNLFKNPITIPGRLCREEVTFLSCSNSAMSE